ncbi:hypothetical protein AZZ69_004781, partial [Klebsiella pneumoniae]
DKEAYNMVRDVSSLLGCRQSMPSRSIASCAGVRNTLPSRAEGQAKRPRSSRLVSRHSPSPVDHSSLTLLPLRPRKMKTWPDIGSSFSIVCTFAARPLKPLRMSVIPATSQILVPVGRWLSLPLSVL